MARKLRSLPVAGLAAALALFVAAPAAQALQKVPRGDKPRGSAPNAVRSRLEPPHEVAAGRFGGTWRRVSPGNRQAVALRQDEEGRWQVRLYWRAGSNFELDTEWEAQHELLVRGYAGLIRIELDPERSSVRRLVGSYRREIEGERSSHMVETGELVIYRAGPEGRLLVWLVDPLEREVRVEQALYPDEALHRETSRQIWIMEKVAERQLEWDEIPW